MEKLIGRIHFLVHLFFCLYGITKKNWFDVYYILFVFIVALLWTVLKGECFVSLLIKWANNPSYVMGTDTSAKDLHLIIGKKYEKQMDIILYLLTIIKTWSIYTVLNRLRISYSFIIACLYLFYAFNTYKPLLYQFIFFCIFAYVLYKLKPILAFMKL
jgi:hypothetical protein